MAGAVAQLSVDSTKRFYTCLQQLAEAENLLSGVRSALTDIYADGKALPSQPVQGGTISKLFNEAGALSRFKIRDRPEDLPQTPPDPDVASVAFRGPPHLAAAPLAPKASPDCLNEFPKKGNPTVADCNGSDCKDYAGINIGELQPQSNGVVASMPVMSDRSNVTTKSTQGGINTIKKYGLHGMLTDALNDPKRSLNEIAELAADILGIPEDDFFKCREIFDKGDKDKSGVVDTAELKELLEAAAGSSMTKAEYKSVLKKFDANNDGGLDFEEFLLAFSNTPNKATESLRVQIDTMANTDKNNMANERCTLAERAWHPGVNAKVVQKYLRNELKENEACFQIPVIIILFLSWFMSVYTHYRMPELHAVEEAVRYDIRENANFAFGGAQPFDNGRMGHKNLDDVNSIADFWSWLDLGVVNLFFPEDWDVSEARANVRSVCVGREDMMLSAGYNKSQVAGVRNDMPDDCPIFIDTPPENAVFENPTYMLFNTIVGGVRLRQEIMEPSPCSEESETAGRIASTCFRGSSDWLRPELHNVLAEFEESLVNQPGAETVYIPTRSRRDEVRRKLRELEDRGWLGPKTTKVEVLFTTHNPHEDVFVATIIRLYLNRAGRMHKIVEPVGIWVYPFHGWECYFFDAIWVALTFKLFVDETCLIAKYARQLGFVRGIQAYASLANLIDWISITYSLMIGVGFCYICLKIRELRGYLDRADLKLPGSWEYDEDIVNYYDLALHIVILSYRYRSLLMGYPFVIGARLFKAFDAQPRLAMVTRTMQRASTDILHFGVVFFCAFLFYTSSAMIMFGSESLNFATPTRACTAVFVMLIGGFEWDDLSGVGLPQAMIWFWSFMILVQLIMLNMLLAIVMDIYTEVKGGVREDAETMYTQIAEIFRRWYEKKEGTRVSLEYVLKVLDPEELDTKKNKTKQLDEVYTVTSMVAMVPHLNAKQAERILVGALQDQEILCDTSLAETAQRMQSVEERVDSIHTHMARQFQMQQMMSTLLSSTTKDISRQLRELATSGRC